MRIKTLHVTCAHEFMLTCTLLWNWSMPVNGSCGAASRNCLSRLHAASRTRGMARNQGHCKFQKHQLQGIDKVLWLLETSRRDSRFRFCCRALCSGTPPGCGRASACLHSHSASPRSRPVAHQGKLRVSIVHDAKRRSKQQTMPALPSRQLHQSQSASRRTSVVRYQTMAVK